MIKKLLSLLSVAIIGFTYQVAAQNVPDPGFESWIPQPGPPAYSDPLGWGTLNALSNTQLLTSNSVTCFKDSTNVHSGKYAMKIVTASYTASPYLNASNYLPNGTLDYAFTGAIEGSTSIKVVGGYPEVNRYASLSFYAMYAPVGNDEGTADVVLWANVGGKRDTVAEGQISIPASSSFSQFTVNLTYKPTGVSPDSAIVLFSSSGLKGAQLGSTLIVDDISFSGNVPTGIVEPTVLTNSIRAFPNPSSDLITLGIANGAGTFNMIEIFDASGRMILTDRVQNNQIQIRTSNYSQGLYSYRAYDVNSNLIGVGKFSVVK